MILVMMVLALKIIIEPWLQIYIPCLVCGVLCGFSGQTLLIFSFTRAGCLPYKSYIVEGSVVLCIASHSCIYMTHSWSRSGWSRHRDCGGVGGRLCHSGVWY